MTPVITVIVPTFNEAEHIESTVKRLADFLDKQSFSYELLFIDDSKDETPDLLEKSSKAHTHVRCIHRTSERGVGSAIRRGIAEARGTYAVILMSDAPQDVAYIPKIVSLLEEGYDVVVPSRFMKGCKVEGYPKFKRACNIAYNAFINVLFWEFKIRDFSYLFKAFRTDKIRSLNLESNYFDIGTEIILKAMKNKYRITEIPVDMPRREKGISKLKLSREGKNYLARLFKIRFSR